MKSKSTKEKLNEAENSISRVTSSFYHSIGQDKIFDFILSVNQDKLEYLEEDIKREENYLKECKDLRLVSNVASITLEVKELYLLKKEKVKQIKMFEQFVKQTQKVDKLSDKW